MFSFYQIDQAEGIHSVNTNSTGVHRTLAAKELRLDLTMQLQYTAWMGQSVANVLGCARFGHIICSSLIRIYMLYIAISIITPRWFYMSKLHCYYCYYQIYQLGTGRHTQKTQAHVY